MTAYNAFMIGLGVGAAWLAVGVCCADLVLRGNSQGRSITSLIARIPPPSSAIRTVRQGHDAP